MSYIEDSAYSWYKHIDVLRSCLLEFKLEKIAKTVKITISPEYFNTLLRVVVNKAQKPNNNYILEQLQLAGLIY